MLQQLKHYVCPDNPLDGRLTARLKRGAIHYAQIESWWRLPRVQRWIQNHRFHFQHGRDGSATHLCVSGGDITHLWVADEVLIEKVYQLDAVPFTPDVVLDCGANIGLFTLLAAQRWPSANFICVEPHPTTFSFLCENLALNDVQATRLQCALDAEVAVKFLQNEGAVFQALSTQTTDTRVTTLRLESLLPQDPEARVLIKMDIEGSELAVLEDVQGRLPERCFLFIELHGGDESLRWMSHWAESSGFVFHEVRRREDAIDGYLARGARNGMARSSASAGDSRITARVPVTAGGVA